VELSYLNFNLLLWKPTLFFKEIIIAKEIVETNVSKVA
jgi:hypothetical protein